MTVFDGTRLHGVVPGAGFSTSPEKRRVTWMVSFWEDVKTRPWPDDGTAGSSRPFPSPENPAPDKFTWHKSLNTMPSEGSDDAWTDSQLDFRIGSLEQAPVQKVEGGVWTKVDEHEGRLTELPDYQECWQF